jgi:hypothetical protein
MSSKDKGIKISYMKKLSKIGVKFPIDEPHFTIQGHAICPIKDNEKVPSSVMVSYVSCPNKFTQQQNTLEYDIRMNLMESSHKIKSLRESVKFSMDAIKRIIKHSTMMNNQVEQMISPQNILYERLLAEKKPICSVETRSGISTQDPDYPEGHPKRKEKYALKMKKSSAGKSPNEIEANGNSEE